MASAGSCGICGATGATEFGNDGSTSCEPCHITQAIGAEDRSSARSKIQTGIVGIVLGLPVTLIGLYLARLAHRADLGNARLVAHLPNGFI